MFSKPHRNELKTPSPAVADPEAAELIRAWIVGGGLHVSLRKGFDDPSAWGLMLVDIARHASRMYAAEGDYTEQEAMQRIRALWNAEIADPTDEGVTRAAQ